MSDEKREIFWNTVVSTQDRQEKVAVRIEYPAGKGGTAVDTAATLLDPGDEQWLKILLADMTRADTGTVNALTVSLRPDDSFGNEIDVLISITFPQGFASSALGALNRKIADVSSEGPVASTLRRLADEGDDEARKLYRRGAEQLDWVHS